MRNKQINLIVKDIQTTLRNGWAIKENIFTPTTSIGISLFPDHGNTIDELLEKADAALYEVKRMGKNQHFVYLE
jgi:diguanylate cyclase (GGDEF)-like protein